MSGLRGLFAALLTLAAWGLAILGALVPLHEYAWAEAPGMQAMVRPEAALTLAVLSTAGLVLAVTALVLAFRLEPGRRLFRGLVLGAAGFALVLCVLRLVEVFPAWAG